MKITESELQARRKRIIDVAFRLFCRDGIEKVSIAQIAQGAQVGESTVYRYYGNKTFLVLATLDVLWRSIGESLERMVAQYKHYGRMTGLEQVAVHLEAFRHLYMENADYVMFSYEAKLYLQRNGVALTQEELDRLMSEIKVPCTASLQKGLEDGSIPLGLSADDLFYAVWGSIRGYIVKIVIYDALCRDGNPWIGRYDLVERGILTALSRGFRLELSESVDSPHLRAYCRRSGGLSVENPANRRSS